MRKYEDKDWITVKELAELMCISPSSANLFVKDAPFTVIILGKKLIRIPVKAYYEWYDSLMSGAGLITKEQSAQSMMNN